MQYIEWTFSSNLTLMMHEYLDREKPEIGLIKTFIKMLYLK